MVLATASPDKFPEAVREAGVQPAENPAIEALFHLPTRCKRDTLDPYNLHFSFHFITTCTRCDNMGKHADWEALLRLKIEEISRKHSS